MIETTPIPAGMIDPVLAQIPEGAMAFVHGNVNPVMNPMGYVTTQREGDSDLEHVFGILRGKAQTTGAQGLKFGEVPLKQFVQGKTITVKHYPGLTPTQLENMNAFYRTVDGTPYNVLGYAHLILRSFLPGRILKLYPDVRLALKKYFCSQLEQARFTHANTLSPQKFEDGIILNKEAGKLDITAYAPSTLFWAHELEPVFERYQFASLTL